MQDLKTKMQPRSGSQEPSQSRKGSTVKYAARMHGCGRCLFGGRPIVASLGGVRRWQRRYMVEGEERRRSPHTQRLTAFLFSRNAGFDCTRF